MSRCRSFLPDLMAVRAVMVRAAMEGKMAGPARFNFSFSTVLAPLFFHLLPPLHRPGLSLWQVPPHSPLIPPSTHTTSNHPPPQARLVIVAGPSSPFPTFSYYYSLFEALLANIAGLAYPLLSFSYALSSPAATPHAPAAMGDPK